ncbi:MAG: hypothetical protein HFJ87_03025, partial [Muribaculaceae bacterium]|nr:hypothetical protein [Muribaculaceae bacterium]
MNIFRRLIAGLIIASAATAAMAESPEASDSLNIVRQIEAPGSITVI